MSSVNRRQLFQHSILGLAAAGGRLFVSTDTGALYCFASDPAKKNSIKAKVEPSPFGKNTQFAAVAKDAIKLSGATKGFALDLGCGEGQLTLELAKASTLYVIGVESDSAKVALARSKLSANRRLFMGSGSNASLNTSQSLPISPGSRA